MAVTGASEQAKKRPFTMEGETIHKRLVGKDMSDALNAARELKEGIETAQVQEFQTMLGSLIPAFSSVLGTVTRPNPDVSSVENVLRNITLDVISRIPKDDILRPHSPTLLGLCLDVLARDYEDNALLASKIIFDLHKSYRPMSQDQVQPYLDFVQQVYRSLPASVQRNFHFASQEPAASCTPSPAVAPFSMLNLSSIPADDELNKKVAEHAVFLQDASPSSCLPTSPTPKVVVKSMSSFRVLTECPLTVMLLFQLYPKFLKTNMPTLIQLMMEALAIRSPPLQSVVKSKIENHNKRLYYNRSRELVAAQVKTLSFLTYHLRGFVEQMKPYEDRIATNVISLMTACPRESIGTRKELMVATRHILATDFRKGFFRHVDSLLDERILMGSHRHSDQSIIRPLGYSTLADLVHHFRAMLTLKQLSRIVYIFSRVLHDSSMNLPVSIQITAVRLLLNVVDIIFNNKDPNSQIGRDLLDRILDTLVHKLGTLRDLVAGARNHAMLSVVDEGKNSNGAVLPRELNDDASVSLTVEMNIECDPNMVDIGANFEGCGKRKDLIDATEWMLPRSSIVELQDLQSMVRSIIVGLKTLVWCICNYRLAIDKDKSGSGAIEDTVAPIIRMTTFERDLVEKYIEFAIPCTKLFSHMPCNSVRVDKSMSSASDQQERDVVTYFAACFAVLDSFNLRRTLGTKIGLLVETLVDDSNMMVFPRQLLGSNPRTSAEFCEILLGYLVDNIDHLSVFRPSDYVFLSRDPGGDECVTKDKNIEKGQKLIFEAESMSAADTETMRKTASTHLELFERILKSMAAFPENERALRPFLQRIVSSSLRLSMEKGQDWPDHYCSLLRSIFRSISAGKFEDSYKELLPIIPAILNGLHRIFQSTEDEPLQSIIIELCLTIPARLSSLLPHMPLLLRMIVPSLRAGEGDLVNLGLRTLEFWVDNLNPAFLYPILARQTTLCTDLLVGLTSHLRPAPYPYGLLALRLLGKLGGKNRRFLRNEIVLPSMCTEAALADLSMECQWPSCIESWKSPKNEEANLSGKFSVRLPLDSAVRALKTAAQINFKTLKSVREREEDGEFGVVLRQISRNSLMTESIDVIDLATYCYDVAVDTVNDQSRSAVCVLGTVLAELLDLDQMPPDLARIEQRAGSDTDSPGQEEQTRGSGTSSVQQKSECLKTIMKGFLFGLSVDSVQQESLVCAKGMFLYFLAILTSWHEHVIRVDANGSPLSEGGAVNHMDPSCNEVETSRTTVSDSKDAGKGASLSAELGSLRPFGYFELTSPFNQLNPFVICDAIAEMISDPSSTIQTNVLQFFEEVLRESLASAGSTSIPTSIRIEGTNKARLAFYETLLEALCRFAVTKSWNVMSALRNSILVMINLLGSSWARQYEVELVHAAISSVKNAGREIPHAGVKAFQFFASIFMALYGKPANWDSISFVSDILSVEKDNQVFTKMEEATLPSDAVLNLLIIELASTKQLVRFAARYALKCHVFQALASEDRDKKISSHMSTIKRVLFTRSLRLLPLPEQVAVIEALTTLVDFVPGLLPVADQHLLAFLSEFLKLSSIADGEMSDSSIVGFVVDKNGFTTSMSTSRYSRGSSHTTGMFLRRECVARLCGGKFISIPEELPLGVQLRVSALRLLNTVICRHADGFFDADSTTPIGNIRPHVISLLFRSLVSQPPMSVRAAHVALQDVLALSVVTKDDGEGSKSQSRLPKELLQTCIRPVLLNLRDYTRLSVPLLRGLSRLLSLLSSWFNKTLGEKLLEHLQKWTEPELIMACNIWKVGEEPVVAARIVDLFALLPHAAHFVEPLVKTVIKLEAVVHRFKGHQDRSPYREPLARYLNKHSQYAVSFFFQRLKTPMYNELFQDVVAMKESETLRSYLSGRQCSITMLNVCFERPLAIIRSEKTSTQGTSGKVLSSASNSPAEIMSIHGITADSGKQREISLRHDIDSKQKKLSVLQQEAARTKEALQTRLATVATGTEVQESLEDIKRRHRAAQAALDKAQKELTECKQRYAVELTHPETLESSSSTKKMTIDALELQYQGLTLVRTLVKYNRAYLTEHNDIVRAFRWLWRSKGRHLRLQHEELMPPRFHRESMLLGSLLVDYATACPNDVDVLFEILRIFLQPTTCDFGFIRSFLAHTVSNVISMEKKRHIMQRFFALMVGEGPEETKVLSVQLMVIPMLLNTFNYQEDSSTGDESRTLMDVGEANVKDVDICTTDVDLVDPDMVKKLVQEVLLKNGNPSLYGDRARVELLRLSTLLIRSKPNLMHTYQKDLIKFSWGLLKSDDTSCKGWAYLNVCSFISAFETPGKIVIQVYVSLIRMHQHETKEYVRSALSMLLPSLSRKLDEQEFGELIDRTVRLIQEESNNIPQLSHIWQTIVSYPSVFVAYRGQFVRHMVNSLSMLGLTLSCPIENRVLSLSIAELVLQWQKMAPCPFSLPERGDHESSALMMKKVKGTDGEVVDIGSGQNGDRLASRDRPGLDIPILATVANFLVRMTILLADTTSANDVQFRTRRLLSLVLRKWQFCEIDSTYFEKVVSICLDEVASMKVAGPDLADKKAREKTKSRGPTKPLNKTSKSLSSKSSPSPAGGKDERKQASSTLLNACLEIFTLLVSVAPTNPFIRDNVQIVKEILEPCFLQANHRDGKNTRQKLKEFLVPFVTADLNIQGRDSVMIQHVKVLLEAFITNSIDADALTRLETLSGPDARNEEKWKHDQIARTSDNSRVESPCLAYFSLDIISEVSKVSPLFVEGFTGSLVALLERLVANHLQEIGSEQRAFGVPRLLGSVSDIQNHQPTPTRGILDDICAFSRTKKFAADDSKSNDKSNSGLQGVPNLDKSLKNVVSCMTLICSSDLPYCFNKSRQVFMETIGLILDSSNNIQLLLTAVGIVGKWLASEDGSGPLALEERVMFLRKIISLDNRPIPSIVAQSLADLIGTIVLAIAERGVDTVFPARTPRLETCNLIELDIDQLNQLVDSTQTLFHRAIVACVLHGNPSIRHQALLFYQNLKEQFQDDMDATLTGCGASRPGKSVFEMLWQLFNSDYEGVRGRMWQLVFVEALMHICLPGSGTIEATGPWLPRPRRPRFIGSNVEPAQDTLVSFFSFMTKFKEKSEIGSKCVSSVLSLAHGDANLTQRLFESLMISAWSHLDDDEFRSLLIRPMEKLLSRPHNKDCFVGSSGVVNAVHGVLRVCRRLHPQPVLDPDVLISLGGIYGATHEVVALLEQEYRVIGSCCDSVLLQKIISGIRTCMQQLREENLDLGLAQKWCKQPETNYVLSLDIHGLVAEAITGYTKLVDFSESCGTGEKFRAADLEMDLWEDRWIHLQKEVCQMEVVADFASANRRYAMLLDAAWKNQDWDMIENLTSFPELVSLCERGDPLVKMCEILLAITRGKLSEVENLHTQTAQLCLQKWQSLPCIASGSHQHSELLHSFHRLVEFRESGQIMVETTNHSNRRTLPDLQNLLSAWRHRLPNHYDSLADWNDIITWRSHMFSSITSNFQWSEAGALSTLHDRPWTAIRMAKTARKQGIADVARMSLNKISDSSIDVSDAFSKLREQILILNNPDSDLERTAGLNLVNTTNLGFFDGAQKSELFRLKAQFLSSLAGRSKANQAYCHAVQVCPTYAKAWISWGSLCLSLGRLAEKQQAEQHSEATAENKENPNAKKVAQYLAQAMGCYLEAVNCDTDESSRIHLPKCLWMLAKDGSAPGVLNQTMESRGVALPCWVWLPWCPQLLTSLYRNEGKAAKAILTILAKTYPQALYFPLRAFYLERRDVERSKGSLSGSQQGSVVYSEELMSSLRRAHASLWSSLEAILEELIVKFRPSYEEELLATITALLERAETQIETSVYSATDSSEDEESVVASIAKTLGRIATKFFRESPSDPAPSKRDERARKTEAFKEKYKALFENDFLALTAKVDREEKIELNDFLERLRKWKKMLEGRVSSTPKLLPLVESSPSLALFSTEAPDLWPMSCDPREAKEMFEKGRPNDDKQNSSSTSTSALAAQTAAVAAAIAVAHSAASEGHGGEYGGGSSSIEIPGQYAPNTISAIDTKPCPELHAKLLRFEPRVHVVRRSDHLIRRIGMFGSDGRCYHFLLQFAIPYWTRTDERTVQLCYVFEKIFRRNVMCSRNFLSLQPSPVIPIAQRLRMTCENEGRLSLDDVFKRRCEAAGCETTVIASYYQSRVKKLLDARRTDTMTPDQMKKLVLTTNVDVLREVCETKVDGTILLDHVQGNLGSAEGLFNFRRAFTSHLAINSLMQHAFCVVVRTPSRVVTNEMTGQVLSPEFRLSYNNQGFLDSQKVPFRMTPNLREMIGSIMLEGRFVPSMSIAATAIKSSMEDIDSILRLLVRDDIVSWYTSKSMAKSDIKTQELENQLGDRVAKNVAVVQSKISECSIQMEPKESIKLKIQPINQRVKVLLAEACSYERLASMESSFQPWL